MPLLCDGKHVVINIEDALKVLTEEEYVILDMLMEKVLEHSNKEQLDKNNRLIKYLGKEFVEKEMSKE